MKIRAVNAAAVNGHIIDEVDDTADIAERCGEAELGAALRMMAAELRAGRNVVLISGDAE